ncbi:MAG: PaaI family thioesterase [Verrucomicrobia bacterium]|nr:PaaI family thioesterase [Verrucomicrobiota bacterium]
MKLEDNHQCFACGLENPHGLRLHWQVEGHTMTTEFIAEQKYQGWKGIVHGGILATLLDEAMTRLAWIVCGGALTAEMTVRYVAPAPIGELLYVRGEIVKDSKRLVEMKAFIHKGNAEGPVIAHAVGKAIKVSR